MRVYLIHSTKYDFRNELYAPLKASTLNSEHEIIYMFDNTDTLRDSKDIIKGSDLIIAEVSHAGVGSGIELGWADMLGLPIICFYKTGLSASKSLPIITTHIFEYDDEAELVATLAKEIAVVQTQVKNH